MLIINQLCWLLTDTENTYVMSYKTVTKNSTIFLCGKLVIFMFRLSKSSIRIDFPFGSTLYFIFFRWQYSYIRINT